MAFYELQLTFGFYIDRELFEQQIMYWLSRKDSVPLLCFSIESVALQDGTVYQNGPFHSKWDIV